jgi:hypothetical protein
VLLLYIKMIPCVDTLAYTVCRRLRPIFRNCCACTCGIPVTSDVLHWQGQGYGGMEGAVYRCRFCMFLAKDILDVARHEVLHLYALPPPPLALARPGMQHHEQSQGMPLAMQAPQSMPVPQAGSHTPTQMPVGAQPSPVQPTPPIASGNGSPSKLGPGSS